MKFAKETCVALFLILSVSISLLGQAQTGAIEGIILDSGGAVIPGANVSLRHKNSENAQDVIRQTTSNGEGKYRFSGLALGIYEVVVKTTGLDREFVKVVELTTANPTQSVETKVIVSLEPCSEEGAHAKRERITDKDRSEIVQSIVDLIPNQRYWRTKKPNEKPILHPSSIKVDWLLPEQKSRIAIMTRTEIQELTDKTESLVYYSISAITQKGGCIGISLLEHITVKGQLEDANMAGGGSIYEFRRVGGRWVRKYLISWIS